jgi:plasmid stabilization system protein ParE
MIVVLTAEAEADLEQIADYIAADNPKRALSFVVELRQCCERLAEIPKGFPLVPRYEHVGIRRRVYGAYLIFYRVTAGQVEVLHILHGAVNYEPLLFPEG